MHEPQQGLGLSLSFYLGALLCGLMLFVGPIYWFNSGVTLQNPGVAAYNPPPGATLVRTADPNAIPLAMLKREDIVSPAQLAAISAKSKGPERPRTVHRERDRENTDGRTEGRYAAQPAPRGGFFFGLF